MRFCLFGSRELGIVENDRVLSVGRALTQGAFIHRYYTMVDVIFLYELRESIREVVANAVKNGVAAYPTFPTFRPSMSLSEAELLAPILHPGKIWAVEGNYQGNVVGVTDPSTIISRTFLKPASSITGPNSTVQIPRKEPFSKKVDVETELCVVIGKKAKSVSEAEALSYAFGYTVCLDIGQTKSPALPSVRKGCDTFTPLGPWIVTRDEVPDPQKLGLKLWQNDVLRQDGNTKDMICSVKQLIASLSDVSTLYPGDLIITGTPYGTSEVKSGDTLKAQIDKIGELQVTIK